MHVRKLASVFCTALAVAAITFSLAVSSQAQTLTILHNFDGQGDGGYPYGGLLLDSSGNLYGTTTGGGNLTGCDKPFGCGVAFELSKLSTGRWSEAVLKDLNSTGGSDAGLISDAAGNLYGTTLFGGSPNTCIDYGQIGCGSVFMLSKGSSGWTRTNLYAFTGGSDGALPYAHLTFDSAGNLYGTTGWGGDLTACSGTGCGTVFELSPNGDGTWTESVIYAFTNQADGGGTEAPVIFDTAGNLYGTTPFTSPGNGGIWELSPTGSGTWSFQMIYVLAGGSTGATPYAGLAFDSAGNLYATTDQQGDLSDCRKAGCGTVIEVSPVAGGGWSENTLLTFTGTNGAHPLGQLMVDKKGNLYGTTQEGGSHNQGVLYELSPASGGTWTETILHSFGSTPTDATDPTFGQLIMDSTGAIYGTTYSGGKYNQGTVFKLVP